MLLVVYLKIEASLNPAFLNCWYHGGSVHACLGGCLFVIAGPTRLIEVVHVMEECV